MKKAPKTFTSDTTIEQSPGMVRIVMPVPRIRFVLILLGLWFVGWAVGEITVLRALLQLESLLNADALLTLVWLLGWTVGGVAAAFGLAVMLDGREILTVSGERIHRRVEAFNRGWDTVYPMDTVTDFRQTGGHNDLNDLISFETDGRTISLGTGLTESAAEKAVHAVWTEFPHLVPPIEMRTLPVDPEDEPPSAS